MWELQLAEWPKYGVGGSVVAMSLPLLRAALAALAANVRDRQQEQLQELLCSGDASCSPTPQPQILMQRQRIRQQHRSLQANSVRSPALFGAARCLGPPLPI